MEYRHSNITNIKVFQFSLQIDHALHTGKCLNLWFPLKTKSGAETVIHKCPRHLNLDYTSGGIGLCSESKGHLPSSEA